MPHCFEYWTRYKQNRNISMGSEKWLDAELFDSTKDCIEELKSRGYRIAVASIGHHSVWDRYMMIPFTLIST